MDHVTRVLQQLNNARIQRLEEGRVDDSDILAQGLIVSTGDMIARCVQRFSGIPASFPIPPRAERVMRYGVEDEIETKDDMDVSVTFDAREVTLLRKFSGRANQVAVAVVHPVVGTQQYAAVCIFTTDGVVNDPGGTPLIRLLDASIYGRNRADATMTNIAAAIMRVAPPLTFSPDYAAALASYMGMCAIARLRYIGVYLRVRIDYRDWTPSTYSFNTFDDGTFFESSTVIDGPRIKGREWVKVSLGSL